MRCLKLINNVPKCHFASCSGEGQHETSTIMDDKERVGGKSDKLPSRACTHIEISMQIFLEQRFKNFPQIQFIFAATNTLALDGCERTLNSIRCSRDGDEEMIGGA